MVQQVIAANREVYGIDPEAVSRYLARYGRNTPEK